MFVVGLGSNAYTLANFEIKGVDVSPVWNCPVDNFICFAHFYGSIDTHLLVY